MYTSTFEKQRASPLRNKPQKVFKRIDSRDLYLYRKEKKK